MKILLLIVPLYLLSGCSSGRYTYITQMPNEPAFTKKAELRAQVAAGTEHFEATGALSVSNHIGLQGSLFTGGTGRISSEAGMNVFTGISNNRYISLAAGVSGGFIIGKYGWHTTRETGGGIAEMRADIRFRGLYLQPSYYRFIDETGRNKLGFSIKISAVNFKNYDAAIAVSPANNPAFTVKYNTASQMFIASPFVHFTRASANGIFEISVLTGFHIIRGFNAGKIEAPVNYPNPSLMANYTLNDRPYINNRTGRSLIFLNISLGLRLDLLQ